MPLAHVFNMSLQEGIVPLELKEANFIPLLRKCSSSKGQQTLGIIGKNLNKCPTHMKAVACTSLVRPILEYASAAYYDPHSQNNIKTLERIQRQPA